MSIKQHYIKSYVIQEMDHLQLDLGSITSRHGLFFQEQNTAKIYRINVILNLKLYPFHEKYPSKSSTIRLY